MTQISTGYPTLTRATRPPLSLAREGLGVRVARGKMFFFSSLETSQSVSHNASQGEHTVRPYGFAPSEVRFHG
jgi:hypothetical protein